MNGRDSGLVLLPGGNGHASASSRRISALEVQVEFYKSLVAALLVREGGIVSVPREAISIRGNLKITTGPVLVRLELISAEITAAAPEEPSKPDAKPS